MLLQKKKKKSFIIEKKESKDVDLAEFEQPTLDF